MFQRRFGFAVIALTALNLAPVSLAEEEKSVTFCREIARILQNRCQRCHHPGTAAPFSLLSYEDARNWGETAKEAILEQRMPPWFADPQIGDFANDCRMSDKEIQQFVSWVDGGMPRGDKAALPEPIQFSQGWQIGEPDVVLWMNQEYKVPATGVVRYKYFEVAHDFKEDKWVKAVELRAGEPEVVHHILMMVHPPRKPGERRNRDFGFFAALAPGSTPAMFPTGLGKKIPKGSRIVFQMHYTPIGRELVDKSSVGLIFAREPVHTEIRTHGIHNTFFTIPPGADNHEVKAAYRFREDSRVISLMPHMHLRGKSFKFVAEYDDGRVVDLLSVPKYDFNWQLTYELKKPLDMPKGARIRCFAHYDNSENNPANPDPKKHVGWGDQTWDEMMIGYIHYHVKRKPKKLDTGG